MKYTQEIGTILKKEQLGATAFDFTVLCPAIAEKANHGQFVNLLVTGHVLRRPISICEIDKQAGTLRLVFETRGEGTQLLSQKEEGEELDILGPLGNGFRLTDLEQTAFFVGGGIGTPPMLSPASAYGKNAEVFLGFRNKDAVILQADFEKAGCSLTIATDDGSAGFHGLVTQPIKERLQAGVRPAVIYACGPKPMLRAVAELAEKENIPCQVSLEERMACGVGACLVCACKVKKETGEEKYEHVCKCGPVFDSKEVVW